MNGRATINSNGHATQMTSSRRPAVTHTETDADAIGDIKASLNHLSKQNAKLERMLERIGTVADNSQFRDLLETERKTTTALTKQLMSYFKQQRKRSNDLTIFEVQYYRFTDVIDKIDTRQKGQILAVSQKESNPLADQLMEEEQRAGRADRVNSYKPPEKELVFLMYNVEEISTRHAQIKAIERDVLEMAEMWRDLNAMVEEQQVHIDVVENKIIHTKDEVVAAHKELVVAQSYQNSMRTRKGLIILVILIVIAAIILIALGVAGKFA